MNDQLKHALNQEDTVLFIGSGISCWAGLPSWNGLLHQLADYLEDSGGDAGIVRRELKQDLLQSASYGFDQLTPPQIGEFIRGACQFGTATPHDIHRKIVTLGPRCFITTNYDQLIEESLRRWQPARSFRIVTNRQPFEEADIVQARAIDFVFKPHGDVGDVESIVLTREHYRKLLEGGDWKHALESLKTLLVTRRVVYLGFGLRDPDFLLLRDVLANTWKGGTRDHYAIMADVSDGETRYWRRNYGIHLISYQTLKRRDGARDHSLLLSLLDELLKPAALTPANDIPGENFSDVILALLRHAHGLMRVDPVTPEFPLRVHSTKSPQEPGETAYTMDRFDGQHVAKFLDEGPERAVLIGLPGAGKTYALCQAAARCARQLHEACLAEPFRSEHLTIPLFADLKLYTGDLQALLEKGLPPGLSLSTLIAKFSIRVFIDSFNEMPREHWERGGFEADLSNFLHRFPIVRLTIGSRTEDGLAKLDMPSYGLDEVDEEFLAKELSRRRLSLAGRFERELMGLLQKPFYFQLVASGAVQLPAGPHPRDIYHSFFVTLSAAFSQAFGHIIDLERALCGAAYEAVNRGQEALPVTVVLQSLKREMQSAGIAGLSTEDAATWLVGKTVLVPYSGGRVAFFHQSVTEFLAATELARLYVTSPKLLRDKLTYTHWDQALFLTLSLLPREQGNAFLEMIIEMDFSLALNAAKYLEAGRDEVVTRLLQEIPRCAPHGFDQSIADAVEFTLPISACHEQSLREILKLGNWIGAAAASRLLELLGGRMKDELLDSIFTRFTDDIYCTRVAEVVRPLITPNDILALVAKAESALHEHISNGNDRERFAVDEALAHLLADIDVLTLRSVFLDRAYPIERQHVRMTLFSRVLWEHEGSELLPLCAELLLAGETSTSFLIANMRHANSLEERSWACFQTAHIEGLLADVTNMDNGRWSLGALKTICAMRHDLAAESRRRVEAFEGIARGCLIYAIRSTDTAPLFDALQNLCSVSPEERHKEPLHLIEGLELDWRGHESLFVDLLRLRDTSLARAILEELIHERLIGEECIGTVEIGPIEWWLDWLADDTEPEAHWWFADRLSRVFADHLSVEAREAFVAEFNRTGSRHRSVLARFVLLHRADLTTDNFSEEAMSFLIEDLARRQEGVDICTGHILGHTATEACVADRLLPLLDTHDLVFRENLLRVLEHAGLHHGRRYAIQ